MLIDATMFYNKVHSGVTVQGQSVSGLTQDEAVAKLTQFVNDSQDQPITLTGGGKTWEVKANTLGVQIDVAAAVATAMNVTRESNPFADLVTKLRLYFRGRDVPLQGTVDTATLDTFIEQIGKELDKPAVNAGLAITGVTISAVGGENGQSVDRTTLRDELKQVLLSLESAQLEVPMVVDEPDVVAEDNKTALAQARTMISAPLVLTWGEKSWTFTQEEIAGFMDFRSEDVNGTPTLEPFLSVDKMAARLQEIGAQTTTENPKDASFKVVNNKVRVVPGVEGVVLDPTKTAEALTAAALKTSERTAEVAGTKQEPDLTTAEAEAMGITDLLGTYTTKYAGAADRTYNVRLTTQYLLSNGKLFLKPGDEFSFKNTVGPRTPERGFKKALGIVPGIKLEDVYGGGICQVSTTLFNTVLLAGLKVTERRNHSIYIEHYPKGRDATVTDDGPDLKFVNDTANYIWITGKSDGKTTTLSIYGTSDGRQVSLSVGNWYAVWGPLTSTTLDPTLSTGVSVIADKGETAKMCMLNRRITYPDGKVVKNSFESNYKHRYMVVRMGTAPTTTTLPSTPTTASPGP